MNFNIKHSILDSPLENTILIYSELQERIKGRLIKFGVETLLAEEELEAVWIGRNALIDQVKMKHEKELSKAFIKYWYCME
jgi:hypothetical protein